MFQVSNLSHAKITEQSEDGSLRSVLSCFPCIIFGLSPFSTCALFPPMVVIRVTVLRNGPIVLRVVVLQLRNVSGQQLLAFVSHQLELSAADRGIFRLFVTSSPGNPSFQYVLTLFLSGGLSATENKQQSIINKLFKAELVQVSLLFH